MRIGGLKRAALAAAVGTGVISGVLAVSSAPAWANGGDAIGLEVRNAQVAPVSSDGLNCTWTVDSKVTVVNLTSGPLDISAVSPRVTWQDSGDGTSGLVSASITGDGGLQAGDTVDPGATQTYEPFDTSFVIPCKADFADLAVQITDQFGTGSGDAPILTDGQPLPVAAVGGVGLAALFGISLVWLQRRRRLTPARPA